MVQYFIYCIAKNNVNIVMRCVHEVIVSLGPEQSMDAWFVAISYSAEVMHRDCYILCMKSKRKIKHTVFYYRRYILVYILYSYFKLCGMHVLSEKM